VESDDFLDYRIQKLNWWYLYFVLYNLKYIFLFYMKQDLIFNERVQIHYPAKDYENNFQHKNEVREDKRRRWCTWEDEDGYRGFYLSFSLRVKWYFSLPL